MTSARAWTELQSRAEVVPQVPISSLNTGTKAAGALQTANFFPPLEVRDFRL
jgi:hypothetical protein